MAPSTMIDFDPMRAPDYSKQDSSSQQAAVGDIFTDVNKRPAYDKQGDPNAPAQTVLADDDDDQERTTRRMTREPSGATGARSSSVSRDRSRGTLTAGQLQQDGASSSSSSRTDSMSPHRAMGARSGSIGSSNGGRRGSETLEGIGQSHDPVPSRIQEEEEGRGRSSRSGANAAPGERILSPSRAMGARSVSRGRD